MISSNSNSPSQTTQAHQMADKKFRLTLVRHGQTNHNRLRLLQGQKDTELNEFGREQASLLARYLKRAQVYHDQVYSSDLSRAYETTRIICSANANRCSSIKRDSLLRERSYGKLQGMPAAVIRELASNSAASVKPVVGAGAGPTGTSADTGAKHSTLGGNPSLWEPASKIHRPEGGETLDEVRARVETFCDQVLFPNAGNHQHILVVSHGGTIREFMKIFKYKYGAQIEFPDLVLTPNTGVNEFDIWLNERQQIQQVRANHLHKLPHLTFDVFNRDNPHVNLNNLHLKTAIKFNETEKQDLKKVGPAIHDARV